MRPEPLGVPSSSRTVACVSDFDPADEDAKINLAMNVYLEARRNGMGEIAAARKVNSTAKEIERFARLNPSFADALEDAVNESLERIEFKMKEAAQDGDFQAGKLVLETHLPTKWVKPERELLIRLGQPEEIDVAELHKRLEAIATNSTEKVLDVDSEEVYRDEDGNDPNPQAPGL